MSDNPLPTAEQTGQLRASVRRLPLLVLGTLGNEPELAKEVLREELLDMLGTIDQIAEIVGVEL